MTILGLLPLMTGPRLGDRACGNNINEGGNLVRRVAAITRVALPGTPAQWRVRVQYIGKAFET